MDRENKSNLANLKCQHKKSGDEYYYNEFTIKELEVWEIKFEK